MTEEQHANIKRAVTFYDSCQSSIEHANRQRDMLASHEKCLLTVGFVGNSGSVDIPQGMQKQLFAFLHQEFLSVVSECTQLQARAVSPAGTEVKPESEFWPEDSGDCS